MKGRLPDVGIISSFLEQFIRPYINSLQINRAYPRTKEETKVEKAIRLKIAALKPMLQDSEEIDKPKMDSENNLTLVGNDETTIIEFLPKKKSKNKKGEKSVLREGKQEDPFQKNINKYKQLRQDIKVRLDKEETAPATKKLIIRTLDEMIAQMIERQCTWQAVDATELKNRLFRGPKNARRSMTQLKKLSNKEWMNLRKHYMDFLKFNHGKEDDFMKQFHDFFSNVMNDTFNLSTRYRVRCQLVKVGDNREVLRENKMVEKNQCDSFKVCSDELKDFLSNFYSYVNDTAVSIFRNYAAMYIRDVKSDTEVDKDIVVSVLENISNKAEKKVRKIFRKKVQNFTLDENKKMGANIQHINDFITATVEEVKVVLKKNLERQLSSMKTKLFTTVKDDLAVNLRVDMDNLGKLFIDRLCALFVICNGRYAARRQENPWTFQPKSTENIYVKVQLTFDDELKDSLARLKIAALKPMLQDSEEIDKPKMDSENNLTLVGNDETTIIEFLPKKKSKNKKGEKSVLREGKQEDPFQKNINKYKQLRQDIKVRLDKEETAPATKKLIIRTLDEMIAQMIERQCTWQAVDATELKNRLFRGPKNARRSMTQLKKLSNKEWMNLRKHYMDFLKFNHGKEDDFMKQFHDFFSNVMNDTFNLSTRYRVRCQLVKVGDNREVLRENKMVEKNQCDSFKVCSDELKDFLSNFYSYVNDTAVSIFRNYAAMYIRDVKSDTEVDKDIVVSVLENISNKAEKKVRKIFRKKVQNFTLDENKKMGANIQHINDFITATVEEVKVVLKKNLERQLSSMKTKLFTTVKDDLAVNLRVDMDNLGKLFIDRLCALFVICNGRYAARRQENPWTFQPKSTENIYVKVQLTFDDELKDSLARYGRQQPWQGDMTRRISKSYGGVGQRKYSNISITRTTFIPTTKTVIKVGNTTKSSSTTRLQVKSSRSFQSSTYMPPTKIRLSTARRVISFIENNYI
uniref:Uncharacterized protein n=1 Tax=Heliothis virescens TaxID=7102 RepID=A0A2A4IZP4_HELVI